MENLLILCPVLLWCALNSLTVRLFRVRFGCAMPFTLTAAVTLLYFSQLLLHSWQPGFYLLLLLALAGAVCLFLPGARREDVFSPGLAAFLLICLLAALLCFRRRFTDFDEFWHWGPMLKESLRLDRFYSVPASRLIIHKDYPPFPAIQELIWIKAAGRYSEAVALMAVLVQDLSLLVLPLTERLCRGQSGGGRLRGLLRGAVCGGLLSLLLLLLLDAFDYAHVLYTILADIPLAVMFGWGLLQILEGGPYRSRFGLAQLAAAGCLLVMTKQAGLAMLLVLWLMYLLLGLAGKELPVKKLLLCSALVLLAPLLLYGSWTAQVKAVGAGGLRTVAGGNGQFDLGKISVSAYLAALRQQGDPLRSETLTHLLKALFTDSVANIPWLPVSYVTAFCLVLLLVLALHRRHREAVNGRRALAMGLGFAVGTAGYAFMLSVLFLFCFTTDEMQELRGYARYVDAFILGELLSLLGLWLLLWKEREKSARTLRGLLAAVLAAAVLLGGSELLYLGPQSLRARPFTQYEPVAELIRVNTGEDDRITVVYNTKSGRYGSWYGCLQSVAYYYVLDRDLPWGTDLYALDYSKEEHRQRAMEQLANSDYLCVVDVNEGLNGFFAPRNGGAALIPGTVYRVLDGGERLERVSPGGWSGQGETVYDPYE